MSFSFALYNFAPVETLDSQHICRKTQSARLVAFWTWKFQSFQRRTRGLAWNETKRNMRKNIGVGENGAFLFLALNLEYPHHLPLPCSHSDIVYSFHLCSCHLLVHASLLFIFFHFFFHLWILFLLCHLILPLLFSLSLSLLFPYHSLLPASSCNQKQRGRDGLWLIQFCCLSSALKLCSKALWYIQCFTGTADPHSTDWAGPAFLEWKSKDL